MKYPCNMIRDLLPLYLDEVCSVESKEIIENHLENCPECKSYFRSMAEADKEIEYSISSDAKSEYQKASSLRAVKKRIFHKQIFAAVIAILVLTVISVSTIAILKNTVRMVPYGDNLSVSMVDGSLIGRLYGSEYSRVKIKNISVNQNGQEQRYIFYQIADTAWNDLSTSKNVFSEYVICPKDKSADTVDRVYYYTGDYTGLDSMSGAELQTVIQNATLLWTKDD